jgi:hypothetical protein
MQYGDLEFVFRADQQTPSGDPEWAIEHAEEVLSDASQDDFLVWCGGDPMSAVVVSTIMSDITGGTLNYLKWERERKQDGTRTGRGYYIAVPLALF